MLDWLSYVTTGVTFGSGAASAHGILSGYRLARKVDLIHRRVELLDGQVVTLHKNLRRMDERLFSTLTQSVWVKGKSKLIEPNRQLLLANGIDDGRNSFISDLYVEAPDGFRQRFNERPSDFLLGEQPLLKGVPDLTLLRDDTLAPWHFKKNGVDMVGFIKRGYLQSYLGLEFVPTLLAKRAEFAFQNPYSGNAMSRNERCYCKSGKRYKHCCGSLRAV